jgi:hypothetical protein
MREMLVVAKCLDGYPHAFPVNAKDSLSRPIKDRDHLPSLPAKDG